MSTIQVSDFTRTLLKAVDDLDAEAYADHLTDDVVVAMGNAEPVVGRESLLAFLGAHFATIETMKHEVLDEWRVGEVLVQQLRVSVVRKNGNSAVVPAANVLKLRDGRAYDYRVYIDLSGAPAH